MKNSTLILVCLAFSCTVSIGQPNRVPVLKAGDWFQVSATRLLSTGKPGTSSFTRNEDRFLLSYKLDRIGPDGSRKFEILVDRMELKQRDGTSVYGYDSYYPPYSTQPGDRPSLRFNLIVDRSGKLRWPAPWPEQPGIPLPMIGLRTDLKSWTYLTAAEPVSRDWLEHISKLVLLPALSNGLTTRMNQGIKPWKTGSVSSLLVAASFPVPGNTRVSGRLLGFDSKKYPTTIRIANREFKVARDGSFSATLLHPKAGPVGIAYDNRWLRVFLKPGDSLALTAEADRVNVNTQFSGSAASDTRLFVQISPRFDALENKLADASPANLGPAFPEADRAFRSRLKQHADASGDCRKYLLSEWSYHLATIKLLALYRTGYVFSPASGGPLKGFPKNYFAEIDTLPVLDNAYPDGERYFTFFSWFMAFQQARLGIIPGGDELLDGTSHANTFTLALATLRGYPLYSVLFDELQESAEESSWKQSETLAAQYELFMRNCGDTSLTNPLRRMWMRRDQWKPGAPLTLLERLELTDGSRLSAEEYEDHPLCLIVKNGPTDDFEPYFLQRIERPEYRNVQVLIAQVDDPRYTDPDHVPRLSSPNIRYIKVKKDRLLFDSIGIPSFESRAYFTAKRLAVTEAPLSMGSAVTRIDELLKQAIAESALADANRQKEYWRIAGWTLTGVLFAVVSGLGLYTLAVRRLKKRESLKRLVRDLQIKAIRSQMNPHFVFNALNSIQALVNARDTEKANSYLTKFSVLLRNVLVNSEKGMIPLEEELLAVKLYTELEQLRFDFNFAIEVQEDVDQLIEIPGMIIQPLAENAVVHGIAGLGKEGQLTIRVSKTDACLQVSVSDNGRGMPVSQDHLREKGFGLRLVEDRMKLLSHNGKEAKLELRTSASGEDRGTTAILNLPLESAPTQ